MSATPFSNATVEVWKDNTLQSSVVIDNPNDGNAFEHFINSLPAGVYEIKASADTNTPGEPGYGTAVKKIRVPADESSLPNVDQEIDLNLREGVEDIIIQVVNYDDNTPIDRSNIAVLKYAGVIGGGEGNSDTGEYKIEWPIISENNRVVIIPNDLDAWQIIRQKQPLMAGTSTIEVELYPPINLNVRFFNGKDIITEGSARFFVSEDGSFWEPINYQISSRDFNIQKASNGTIKYRFQHLSVNRGEIIEGQFDIHWAEASNGNLLKSINVGVQTVTWTFNLGRDVHITEPSLTLSNTYTNNHNTDLTIKGRYSGSLSNDNRNFLVLRKSNSTGEELASVLITNPNVATLSATPMINSQTVWFGLKTIPIGIEEGNPSVR